MKLSVSLADEAVAYIDLMTEQGVYPNRSAALAAAVRVLREQQAYGDYVEMFSDEQYLAEVDAWDGVVADGLSP